MNPRHYYINNKYQKQTEKDKLYHPKWSLANYQQHQIIKFQITGVLM
jgi:hypothetical protein